jgi:2-amino-4-hydroxy-6-hydroxymethyldihydropteridine diphosphokinase
LLGLGSNVGNREATLRAAVAEITALPDLQVVRHSEWHRMRPVGGPAGQADFFNGAAVVETTIAPLTLLAELQQIETRHGRTRGKRWGSRTLDIDVLLYGDNVSETVMLTLPHLRMTFRRFVLEPAAEIAPKMRHPVIGWPIERLLLHLSRASNAVALVSPSEAVRQQVSGVLAERRGARPISRPAFDVAEHHWPPRWTTWLEVSAQALAAAPVAGGPTADLPYAAATFPKLSVLLDADVAHCGADKLQWSTLVRQPGRGPMLRLQTTNPQEIETEVLAAVDAVWA